MNTPALLGGIYPNEQEYFFMKNLYFELLTDEFMLYCCSTQLREKSMAGYEQTLRLFERWCAEELRIFTVDKVTEPVIRKYVMGLQGREKYK